jgi:hypothetical protein
VKIAEYLPIVSLEFTHGDADRIMRCAKGHYDGRCKRQAEEGGVAWQILYAVEHAEGKRWLRAGDVDMLSKICEMGAPDISAQLIFVMKKLNAAFLATEE